MTGKYKKKKLLLLHGVMDCCALIKFHCRHHRSHAIVEVDKALSMLKLIAEFQLTEEFSVLGECAVSNIFKFCGGNAILTNAYLSNMENNDP